MENYNKGEIALMVGAALLTVSVFTIAVCAIVFVVTR